MAITYLASFIAALLLSLLLTRIVRNLARRRGWVAVRSAHHIHQGAIPRLGGVAIFATFAVVTVALVGVSLSWQVQPGVPAGELLKILAPGSLIFLLGLYDDLYSVTPRVKFAVQALAAALLYAEGIGKFELPVLLGFDLTWLSLPLTIFWVLWITNAFNLIDGLDGLAAGSSLFSTFTVFAFSLSSGNLPVALLALILAGSTFGFLRFNFNPATIFLGDSGSLFLGFMLSALALAGSQKTPTIVAVALPIVSFGLPLAETTISVARRFLSGQPLFSADREHIHHKLLERGLTHKQAVMILYGASAFCGLLSLFILQPGSGAIEVALLTLGAGVWMGVKRLGYFEFNELSRAAHRAMDQKRIIANNLALRRAAKKLTETQSFLQVCSILQEALEANDFDGYQLSLAREPDAATLASEFLVAQARRDERHFAWHKPSEHTDEQQAHAPTWSLTLELMRMSNNRRGSFTVYRARNDHPLLVDLNLLTSEFREALSLAVERVLDLSEMRDRRLKRAAENQMTARTLSSQESRVVNFG